MARLELLFAVHATVAVLEEELGVRFEDARDEDRGHYWESEVIEPAPQHAYRTPARCEPLVATLEIAWNQVEDLLDGVQFLEPEFPSEMLLLRAYADEESEIVAKLISWPRLRLLRRRIDEAV